MIGRIERAFWLGLCVVFALGALVQLPFAPARFGGVFFAVLACGCAGEWLMVTHQKTHRACRVTAWIGRVLFAAFALSFLYIQLAVIAPGMEQDAEAETADYLLVLGALVNKDGQPSAALAARCDTAAAFLERHPDSVAILCGGQGANEPCTEADAMFRYMTGLGVDERRLLREDASKNTIENIQNARALIIGQRLLSSVLPAPAQTTAVVTNDYHLARARVLMADAGLDAYGIPAPTPHPGQWVAVRCREYCSILGLMVSGRWRSRAIE